jgi:protein arginine kinase activator
MYYVHSAPIEEVIICPHCGIYLLEIMQTGRVGCAGCYGSFSGRVNLFIRRVHGQAVHTGHIPKSAGEHLYQKRRLTELQNALREAISQQEFEKCAEIRDTIAELTGKGEQL